MTAHKTTKQKIIAAAKVLFSTHGFSRTTINDIITSTGITKGAFYHYFKSKEAVCSEIIDEVKNDYQNIFQSLPKEINPFEKLKTAIFQILELNSSGQWVNCKLMLRLSSESRLMNLALRQKSDDFWKWYLEQYQQMITECREQKLIGNKLSAAQQTDIIISFLMGNIWTKNIFDKQMDNETIEHIIEKL